MIKFILWGICNAWLQHEILLKAFLNNYFFRLFRSKQLLSSYCFSFYSALYSYSIPFFFYVSIFCLEIYFKRFILFSSATRYNLSVLFFLEKHACHSRKTSLQLFKFHFSCRPVFTCVNFLALKWFYLRKKNA